jgi:hypothetical protein
MSTRFSQIITKQLDDYADQNKDKIKTMLIILDMISSLSELSKKDVKVNDMNVTTDLNSFYTTYCKYISKLTKEKNDTLDEIENITSMVQTYESTLGGSNDVNFKSKIAGFCSDLFSNKTIAFNAFPAENLTNDDIYAQISSSELLNLVQLVDITDGNQTEPNPTLPFILDDIMKKFNDYNQKIVSNSKESLAKVGQSTGTTSTKNVGVASNEQDSNEQNEKKVIYSKMINNFESLIDIQKTLNNFCSGVKNSYDLIFKKIVTSQKNNNLIGLGVIDSKTCGMYSNIYLKKQSTYREAVLNAKNQLISPKTPEDEKWTAFVNLMLNITNYYINILYMLMYYNVDISCNELTDSFIDTSMLTSKIYEMYGEQNAIDLRQKFVNLLATTSTEFQKIGPDLLKTRAELKQAQETIKSLQAQKEADAVVSGNESSSTPVTTTGNEPSSTPVTTTGNEPSTTPVTTTGNEPSTTPVTTTGNEPSTTPVTTTGNEPSTTPVTTTGNEALTTSVTTTGNEPSSTPVTTTGNEEEEEEEENQGQGVNEEEENQGQGVNEEEENQGLGVNEEEEENQGQGVNEEENQPVNQGQGVNEEEIQPVSQAQGVNEEEEEENGNQAGGGKNIGLVDELKELSRYLRKYQKKSRFKTRVERLDGRVKYVKK